MYNIEQDAVSDAERTKYNQLTCNIGWFFFKLILLGYVEDSGTGESFFLPNFQDLKIFIEVNTCVDASVLF